MRDIDLFQLALGLVPPWMVADAKFDVDKKRLDIEIDFKVGGRLKPKSPSTNSTPSSSSTTPSTRSGVPRASIGPSSSTADTCGS